MIPSRRPPVEDERAPGLDPDLRHPALPDPEVRAARREKRRKEREEQARRQKLPKDSTPGA